jgi:hypothetical protein
MAPGPGVPSAAWTSRLAARHGTSRRKAADMHLLPADLAPAALAAPLPG